MDIAIKLDVQENIAPVMSPNMKVRTFTKHILRVGFMAANPEFEFGKEEILFTNTTLRGVFQRVEAGELVDAIFISPEQLSSDISEVRTFAKLNSIPLILYTSRYDESYKTIALKTGVDD